MDHQHHPRDGNMYPQQRAQNRDQLRTMDINRILNDEPPPTNMFRPLDQDARQPPNVHPHPIDRGQPYGTIPTNSQHAPNPEFASQFYSNQSYKSVDTGNPLRDQVAATHAVIHRAHGRFGTYPHQATYSTNDPDFNPTVPPFMPNFSEHPTENAERQPFDMTHSGYQPNSPPSSMLDPPFRLYQLEFDDTPSLRRQFEENARPNRTLPPLIVPRPLHPSKMTAADLDVLDCGLCLESKKKDEFPYRCEKCSHMIYCADCLKDWFLDACKNESKMPPKCCQIIPLAVVSKLLNLREIELYKAKYLEWSTVDRLYCPVLTCSAFIPPRQYIEKEKKKRLNLEAYHSSSSSRGELKDALGMLQPPKETKRPVVACPECYTPVCTKCRSFNHLGDCNETDPEPELEAVLKRWKIKRCPKCRAGVRKVYGCHHIECRCGAHFCYSCLQPINLCNDCAEEEDEQIGSEDGEQEIATIDEDDVDGQANFYEGDGRNFGDEPYGTSVDSWSCSHDWARVLTVLEPAELDKEQRPIECHRCFRQVKAQLINSASLKISQSRGSRLGRSDLWRCVCGAQGCKTCPGDLSSWITSNGSQKWTCPCGQAFCKACVRNRTAEEESLEKAMAWTCRCGMIICGACKKGEYVDE